MCNHSCVPNASIRLDESRAHVILARDVAADEEIMLCYSANAIFANREERQAELTSRWRFVCGCERCAGTLPPSEAEVWRMLEDAARAARDAKPRAATVDPSIAEKQRAALAALEARLPHLCERERFRFDADYFG